MSDDDLFSSGGVVGRDLAEVDWASTPLGTTATWPDNLRTMLRVVLSSKFSMWMAWGPELTFFCNDAYRRDTLGAKYPWALGKPAWVVWGEIWDDIGPRIASVLRDGAATWDESLRLVLERSGYREETYHTFSYSPLADRSGTNVGMLCVVAEETDKVLAERRLTTLRDVAAGLAAADSEPDVFARLEATLDRNTCDLPFTFTYLLDGDDRNGDGPLARCVASTGLPHLATDDGSAWVTRDRLRALGPQGVLVDRHDFPSWSATMAAQLDDRMPRYALVVPLAAKPDLEPIGFLAAGLTPERPADDDLTGFVRLLTDQLEAALATVRSLRAAQRRADALTELDRVKTQFFANISHEFRTPLTLIMGPIESLRSAIDATTSPGLADEVEIMHRNALRLSRLVNAVLDFSRLQAGKQPVHHEPLDLTALTHEIADMFRPAIEQAGLDFEVICDDVGEPVHADASMWEKIVLNLLSNALKFTLEGTIGVRLERRDDQVALMVSDSGVGIPADEVPRLFERFHRVERSRARSSEGTGIGLALVAELAALHGGSVDVESSVGSGSTFTVSIPLGAAHLPAADPAAHDRGGDRASTTAVSFLAEAMRWAPGSQAEPTGADATPSSGATARDILVVDDNADMRDYVARLLSARFSVRTAANGAEALASIERSMPDLVLSDIMMPEVDGVELVRRLRDDGRYADLPIILLTAAIGPEATAEGLDVGADDYLVKPFSADDLMARVSSRLAAGHERRQRHALGELATELAGARDAREVVEILQPFMHTWLDTDVSTLAVAADDSDAVALWHCPGYPGGINERYRTSTLTSPTPVTLAISSNTSLVLDGVDAVRERFPGSEADWREAGLQTLLCSPVRTATGKRLGSITSAWFAHHHCTSGDVELHERLASVVAVALDRVRTGEQEHRLLHEFQGRLLEVDHRSTIGVLSARYQPAYQHSVVGGDWYDVITHADGALGISTGDVVGKGLPAATAMSQLRSAVRLAALTTTAPGEVLSNVDRYARHLRGALCASALYMRIDPSGEAAWSRAGHVPPILVTDDGVRFLHDGQRSLLGCPALPDAHDGRLSLPPRSLLLLYTDGLIERRRETIDVGLARLAAVVQAHCHLGVAELCDRLLHEMSPAEGFSDDVALIALRTNGEHPEGFVDAYHSHPANLGPSRRRFAAWLGGLDVEPAEADDLLLAFGETIANAVEHGNRCDPKQVVGVEASVRDGQLVVSVSDAGQWVGDSSASRQAGRGRGFSILDVTTDGVTIQPSPLGTTTTFRRLLSDPSAQPASGTDQ